MAGITPSQTVGPFFAIGLTPHDHAFNAIFSNNLVTPDASGERIRIEGRLLDGDDEAVLDGMIEVWQADAAGRYAHRADTRAQPNAAFKGFGRCGTGPDGAYRFDTIKPGAAPGPNGSAQAPHIVVAVFARGMLRQVYTRLYFADENANGTDPILAAVPAHRRATLIAQRTGDGLPVYRFDIRLQGDRETVFFEI